MREVAVTTEGRTFFGAGPMKWQRVQQHVVARPVEPRQREKQAVEQVWRSHEPVNHAEPGVRPVVVAPVLRAHYVIASIAAALLTQRRVDGLETAVEADVVHAALGHPLCDRIGGARRDTGSDAGAGKDSSGSCALASSA